MPIYERYNRNMASKEFFTGETARKVHPAGKPATVSEVTHLRFTFGLGVSTSDLP
jgi:hypothetical protein